MLTIGKKKFEMPKWICFLGLLLIHLCSSCSLGMREAMNDWCWVPHAGRKEHCGWQGLQDGGGSASLMHPGKQAVNMY